MFTPELITVTRQLGCSDWLSLYPTFQCWKSRWCWFPWETGAVGIGKRGTHIQGDNQQRTKKGLLHPLMSDLCRLRIAHRNKECFLCYHNPSPASPATCHWPLEDVVTSYLGDLQPARPNMSYIPCNLWPSPDVRPPPLSSVLLCTLAPCFMPGQTSLFSFLSQPFPLCPLKPLSDE